jgi:hypothetical protein
VLIRFQSKKNLVAETGQQMNVWNQIETEKLIEDYVELETPAASQ